MNPVVWRAGFIFVCASFTLARGQSALNDSMTNGSATPVKSPALATDTLAASARENKELGIEVSKLCQAGKYDEALAQLKPVLAANPQNLFVLSLRGYVYSKQAKWDLARADFEAMLALNPKLAVAKFDLAELKFQQKDYTGARPGFATLADDADLADLAAYKVFLCDLFGGDLVKAQKEREVFDLERKDPGYYFANAAWELYHKNPEAARPWLVSATRIYFPAKVENYAHSLVDLGYLPLPPAPAQ